MNKYDCYNGSEYTVINGEEALADYICKNGYNGNDCIINQDGYFLFNTIGPYIDNCPDKDFLSDFVKILVPKQLDYEARIYSAGETEVEIPEGIDELDLEEKVKNIRVVYFPVNSEPKVIEITDKLSSYQNLVGGYIEVVPLPIADMIAVVNEEGKLQGLDFNRFLYDQNKNIVDNLVGDFFVCYAPDEEFESVPDNMIETVKDYFDDVGISCHDENSEYEEPDDDIDI